MQKHLVIDPQHFWFLCEGLPKHIIWKPQIWWLINMLPLKVAILGGYTSLPNTEKSYGPHILYPMIRTWYPHYITFSSCTRFVTALADERPAAHAKAAPLCSTFRARFCNVRKRSSRISRVNCCCSPLWRNWWNVMKCESKKNVPFFLPPLAGWESKEMIMLVTVW